MRKEKGFSTLEIIMVMLIISTLAGVVIPKMARIVDTATLNYETKKFQSEFFFARSLSRSASYEPTIFSNSLNKPKQINFFANKKGYRIEHDSKILLQYDFIQKNFTLSYPSNLNELVFTSNGKIYGGKKGTYIFTSPLKNQRNLILDSVGRLRIDKND